MDRTITKDEVREILYSYGLGAILTPADQKIITTLLQSHPNAEEKIGSGIDYISVNDGFYGTKCFWIHRTDNTIIDFSFLACFRKPSDDFPKAARRAVEQDIWAFRRTLLPVFACPLTGEILKPQTAHIDHSPPWTFRKIVKTYLASTNASRIKYDHSGIGVAFANPRMAEKFRTFHNSVAVLRAISKDANLRLPRK